MAIAPADLAKALASDELQGITQQYLRGQMAASTGLCASNLDEMDVQQLSQVLYRSYAYCTVNYIAGNINAAAGGAKHLLSAAAKITDASSLRCMETWLTGDDPIVGPLPAFEKDGWSLPQKIAFRIAADKKFGGMQTKMAALWVKILCRDIGFFSDYEDSTPLWVPVDRVNVRMLCYLYGEPICDGQFAVIKKGLQNAPTLKQQRQSHMAFTEVGAKIMGGPDKAICLEHLWFIGHFYHENMRHGKAKKALQPPEECVYLVCKVRAALRAASGAYADHIPCDCPLKDCCTYDQGEYQAALDMADV